MNRLVEIADEIVEMVNEFPAPESRYEIVEEFLEIAKREDGITTAEYKRIVEILSNRGIV